MKKINYGGSSKILNGIVTKINGIIDKLVVDVKVNGTSVVVVNEDGEREADIDLSVSDQMVKQSPTTDNADYRILLSKSANDTEETDTSRKNTNLKYNPSTGNLQATKLNGNTIPSGSDTIALTSDIPTVVNTYDGTSTDAISGIGVKAALDTLPEPMVFKGSLGTGGTISDLPMDGSATIGDTYKVITEGDYGNNTYHAKVGDTFVCDSKDTTTHTNTWTLFPSGDEPSGTVTSVTIQATSPISVDDSTAITESGTRTISHETSGVTANSYGDSSAQTPSFGGTFKVTSATVNATGHITAMGEHNVTIPSAVATTSANGLMSSTDKTNLDSYRAVSEIRLTNEDLDNVTTVGFYYAAGGNTVTNKPSGYNNFGLVVIHNESGSQYTQIISNENGSYRRTKKANATWTSWEQDKFTDTTYTAGTNVSIDANNAISAVDEKVTQTNNTANTYLPFLLANSTTSPETTTVKKATSITANPSNGYIDVNAVRIHSNVTDHTSNFARLYSANTQDRRYKLPVDKANDSELAVTSDIPTVNNATLTITQNGTSMGTFTANQSTDNTIEVKDEKVSQEKSTSTSYFPILFANSTTDATEKAKVQKNLGLTIRPSTANLVLCRENTSTSNVTNTLTIGNNIADGSTGSVRGAIKLYSKNTHCINLYSEESSTDLSYFLPKDKPNNSILAVTSDIPEELADLADDSTHRLVTDSQISSWNGKIGTDENVKQSMLGTTDTSWRRLVVSDSTSSEITDKVYKANGVNYQASTGKLSIDSADGVANTAKTNTVKIGNNKTKASTGHVEGRIDLYGENGGYSTLKFDTASTAHKTHTLPNKDGTLATTADIPTFSTGTDYGTFASIIGGVSTDTKINLTAPQQPGSQDLNDYKESGIYYFTSTNPASNVPIGSNGVLIVIKIAWSVRDMVKQIWIRHGTNNTNDNQTFMRSYGITANAWSKWHEYVNSKPASDTSPDLGVVFEVNGRDGKKAYTENEQLITTQGETTIYVGNGTAVTNTTTDGNSRGNIRIYGTDNRYVRLTAQDTMINSYRSQLPSKSGILALTSDIAPYESGTTASQAYSIGDYLIWRSQLYRVKASIAIGDTLSTSTNVVSTTIGNEMKWKLNALTNKPQSTYFEILDDISYKEIDLLIGVDDDATTFDIMDSNGFHVHLCMDAIPNSPGATPFITSFYRDATHNGCIRFTIQKENGKVKIYIDDVTANGTKISSSKKIWLDVWYR